MYNCIIFIQYMSNTKIISPSPEVKESSEGNHKISKINNQYRIKYNTQEKQPEFFRESFYDEYIATHGILKAMSERSNETIIALHHMEQNHQSDLQIGTPDNVKTMEVKVNRSALKNGRFDLELYRDTSKTATGLLESVANGTQMFCIAVPVIDNCPSEYEIYQDRFYIIETRKLFDKYNQEQFEGDIDFSFNPERCAVLWQCRIDNDFRSFPLYWNEFKNLSQPDVFKEIFNGR